MTSIGKSQQGKPVLDAWKLPPIVAAITVPIVAGFYLGGPGLGMAVGALAAAVIVVMAVRKPPLRAISPPQAEDLRRHILVVVTAPLEDSSTIEATVGATSANHKDVFEPDVVLVAPCHSHFLERWTSDVGPGRERAQRNLVLSVAALAAAGITASARVGDEDVTQAVEDILQDFPATEVVVADGAMPTDNDALENMRARLRVPLRHIRASRLSRPAPSTRTLERRDALKPASAFRAHAFQRSGISKPRYTSPQAASISEEEITRM
jgi:hypothetical protein